MNTIIAITEQLPYLDSDGNIISFGGGVPRASENLLKVISSDYIIYIIYVLPPYTNGGKIFRYENSKYVYETSFTTIDEVYDKYFLNATFILVIDFFLRYNNPLKVREFPHKKIGLLQTWTTAWDDGMHGIICYGMEDNMRSSPLLLPLGCLYDSSTFYPTNKQRENFALYTGRLDTDKNVQYLMDVWPRIYDKFGITLKLVGPCNVHKIKVPDCDFITNIPPVNDIILANYYNTCKCFIMPSKYETFCCSLVEALACNAPCVVDGAIGLIKKFDGMATYVHGNGYICQNLLVQNIENLLSLSNVSVDSSKFVENHFSISTNKSKVKNFIDLCMKKSV